MQEKYLTVGAITKYIEKKFDADPYMREVFIKGEISNLKQPASGHIYFTLKDEMAILRSVMFVRSVNKLGFQPEDGMNVLVSGRIGVFTKAGRYQFYVETMEPDGIGALYVRFEQLKAKLEQEGLFATNQKKPLPPFPSKVAVVTSHTGAAIRDILTTIKRRMPITEVLVYPTVVQGDKAAETIARNMARINARNDIDVMIIGRGGGSLEELWAFNEEMVVRSVYDSDIPVISAVGHETDFSLADFAADVRAATPTAAAELAVPDIRDIKMRLSEREYRLIALTKRVIERRVVQVEHLRERLHSVAPMRYIEQQQEKIDYLKARLDRAFSRANLVKQNQFKMLKQRLLSQMLDQKLAQEKQRLNYIKMQLDRSIRHTVKEKQQLFVRQIAALEHLSPLNMLKRGYGVTYKKHKIVTNLQQIAIGDEVKVTISGGSYTANVTAKEES